MKIYYFEKVSLFIIGFLTYCVVPAHAQVQKQDSLYQTVSLQHATDDTHNLGLKEVLIPTVVIGASALFVHNGWLTKQRENVQNVLSAKGKYKFKLDDHSQYAPMVAVYGLNLCGIKGKHGFKDRTIILAMSYATVGILVNTMKFVFKEKRPDSNTRNSFPSGHTATVFMGAEFLHKEYVYRILRFRERFFIPSGHSVNFCIFGGRVAESRSLRECKEIVLEPACEA